MSRIKLITILGITFLLLLLGCTFSVNKVSENRSYIDTGVNQIEVDNKLVPYVKEFLEVADKYVNVDSIAADYEGIYIQPIPPEFYGLTWNISKGPDFTWISPNCVEYESQLRVVVWHEMAHKFYRLDHCHDRCDHIMAKYLSLTTFYNDWELQKKELVNLYLYKYRGLEQ